MGGQDNLQVVQGVYAAFGRGDLPAVLGALSDVVEWRVTGASEVPFVGTSCGPEEVAQFFTKLSQTVEFELFDPHEYFVSADKVVVLGRERGRVKSTGRYYESDWAMVFTIHQGKVARFCSYDDGGILDALRG